MSLPCRCVCRRVRARACCRVWQVFSDIVWRWIRSSAQVEHQGEVAELGCGTVVNAGGAWSAPIARMAGITDWPVVPRLRCLFVVHCPGSTYERAPFVVDPSGSFMRRCGPDDKERWVVGASPAADDDPDLDATKFNVGDYSPDYRLFDEVIWPVRAATTCTARAVWTDHD